MGVKIKENDVIKDLAGQPSIIHGTDVDNSLSSTSENALNERVIYNEINNIDTSVTIPDLSGKMLYSSTDAIENEGTNLKVAADTVKADFKSQVRDTSSFEATEPLTAGPNVIINNNIVTGTMGSSSRCVSGIYFDNWGSTGNYEAAKYSFTTVDVESTAYVDNVNVIYVNNDKLGTRLYTKERLYLYFPTTLTAANYASVWLEINGKRRRVQVVGPTGLKEWKPSMVSSNLAGSPTRTTDPLGYDYFNDKNAFAPLSIPALIFGEAGFPGHAIIYYGSWSDTSWQASVLRQNVTTASYIIAQAGTFLELYFNGTDWLVKGNPLVASIPYYLYNIASSSGLRFRTDVGEPSTTQYFAHFDHYANGYFELKGYIPILNSSTASQDASIGASSERFMYVPIRGTNLKTEMTSVTMQDYGSTTSANAWAYCYGTTATDVSSSTSVATATQNELHTFNYGGVIVSKYDTRVRFFHDRYTMGRFFSWKGFID